MYNFYMNKKWYLVSLFVLFCILLNCLGKTFADFYELPFWLDSLGTVLASYVLGSVCGAIVGVAMNILYSGQDAISYVYSITSIAIGMITGFAARKKLFESFFGTMTVSVLITLVSTVVSLPLSLVFSDGMTGNIWGNGVIGFLHENKVPFFFCSLIGHFYVEFLDKIITLFFLYAIVHIVRFKRRNFLIFLHTTKRKFKKIFSKKNLVLLIVGLCAFCTTEKSFAAEVSTYVQTIFSGSSGLPCGEANDIVQTYDGILWIGTYAGLYRYNGSEFRWLNEYESVRSVNCLYVDEEGRLWVGTNDNGVSILINEKIMNIVDSNNGLPSNSVRQIVRSSEGLYYIGTTKGITILTLNSGLKILNTISEIGYVQSLSADTDGHVAAISANGTLTVLKQGNIILSEKLNQTREVFTCCAFAKDESLYVGTSQNKLQKLILKDKKLETSKSFKTGPLVYMNSLNFVGNRIFVCSDSGIGFIDDYDGKAEFVLVNTGNFNNSIDNMVIDYQGNYWFTSSRQGLLRLSNSSFTNLYSALGLTSKVVNSVTEWNGTLYVGTDSGIDAIKQNSSVKNWVTEFFGTTRIRCIKTTSDGSLWVCTYGKGLFEISPNGTIYTYDESNGKFADWVRVCIELDDGIVASAANSGIVLIKNHKVISKITQDDGLPNAMILSLMKLDILGKNAFLAGSDGDGIAIIVDGKIVNKLGLLDGLTSGVILRTVPNTDGNGTFIVTSNSICYMDNNFSIRSLKNFPYFNNYDIWINDEGNLLVLGSAGIYVVNKNALLESDSKNDTIPFTLLDEKNGLNSTLTANSWNYRDKNNNLYLSCGTGVFVLNLENYLSTKRSYRMMLGFIKVNETLHRIERGEPFLISRNSNKIELFPEVINFTVLDPFVSYWLEGFDESPLIIPQSKMTSVVYTNLPSGKYTFHLSVIDENGSVFEHSSYSLIKENEIYDNRYFKIYMLVIILLAVAWFTWFLARRKIQHTLEIQKRDLEFAREQVRMGNETILTIAKTVDAKDENTSQHSMRVSEYSVMIAQELGFSPEECENLRKAALLHDIGKIGIPDRILNKPAKLDADEYEIMKSHVTRGAEILKDFTMIDHVSDGILYHHEKYDGTGYAQGLKGEEIPLYGRIIGVADAFDAMTANRVYRKRMSFDYVVSELKRCSGTQFDPKISGIMLKLIEEGKIKINELYNE